jgi:hypothetical protein
MRRAALPTLPARTFDPDEIGRPDRGHKTMRYGLGAGHARRENGFAELDLRFALHDLLDPVSGYLPTTTTEFGHFRGRAFDRDRRFAFEEINLIKVQFLAPITAIKLPLSWHVALGGARVRGPGCRDCLGPLALYQGGFSYEFARQRVLTYALFGGRAQWVFGLQANAGVRLKLTDRWLSLIEAEWSRALGPGQRDFARLGAETRYGFKHDWAAGLKVSDDRRDDQQITFNLYHYR